MKHLVVAFGISACFLNQVSAQNTPGNALQPTRVVVQSASAPVTKTTAPAKSRERVVYYITNLPATGSHIPLVVRRYKGQNTVLFNSQSGASYSANGRGSDAPSNALSALYQTDPALSSANGVTSTGR